MTAGAWDIPYEDRLIEGPELEPIDLDELKKQRRVSSTSLDTLFDLWASASRQKFEEETSLQLITAQRVFLLDEAPCESRIMFSRGPVQSIVRVDYVDSSGVVQELDSANYQMIPAVATVDTYPTPGGIQLINSATWPIVDTRAQAIRIYYMAGYGSVFGSVPEIIKYALMQYVGAFHRFGEEVTEKELYQLPEGARQVISECKGRMRRTVFPRRSSTSAMTMQSWA